MLDDRYVAGLFDGEGYVRCSHWQKPDSINVRYQIIAGIGMTHRPIIKQLQATFGGGLNQNRHDLRSSVNRIQFTWVVASQKAASFLRQIQPYVIVKLDQVELALQIQASIDLYYGKLGNQYRLHPDRDRIFAERAEMARQLSALKKVAYSPLVSQKAHEPSVDSR